MLIHWCMKGIEETSTFGDADAQAILDSTGLLSAWMHSQAAQPLAAAHIDGQAALNTTALDDHVNDYGFVRLTTPYISLTTGCWENVTTGPPFHDPLPPLHYPAWATALKFATDWGRKPGYIFRCWVVVAPSVAAELPGLADEVRDLNIFHDFWNFHREGEVTAKLYVPRRQVQHAIKVDVRGSPTDWSDGHPPTRLNSDFVPPERVGNIVQEIA
jgi:hypothetical protein